MKENTISGTVKDCNTKDPFPGVNVSVFSNGKFIATNVTGEDGYYNINFLSNYNNFNVTASHTGHYPVTREVTVSPVSESSQFGNADFELGNSAYVNVNTGNDSWDGTSPIYQGGTAGPKKTIIAGIGAAWIGGNLYIASGIYYERIINILYSINIYGASKDNTIIDGQHTSGTIFIINPYNNPGIYVNISNITIRNAVATDHGYENGEDGGGIYNQGILVLTNCNIYNNTARNGDDATATDTAGHGGNGGGIYNHGNLTLDSCTIDNNSAGRGGDASSFHDADYGGYGGGVYNSGTLIIHKCTFTANYAGRGGDAGGGKSAHGGNGGALYNTATGNVTITDSVFDGNHAGRGGYASFSRDASIGGSGGAIYNEGTLDISNSEIRKGYAGNGGNAGTGKSAPGGNGGAICNTRILNLTDSKLNDNYAGNGGNPSATRTGGHGGNGGGIYNTNILNLINCEIYNNRAGSGSGSVTGAAAGYGGHGGGIYTNGASVLQNFKLYNNTAGTGGTGIGIGGPPGEGGYGGGIYNLGNLTINGTSINPVQITNNTAGTGGKSQCDERGGTGGRAGGIYNNGTCTIKYADISNNRAGAGGNVDFIENNAGHGGSGGAIYNEATLILEECTINDNQAGTGANGVTDENKGDYGGGDGGNGGNGGAVVNAGDLTITSCHILNNKAGTGGNGGQATYSYDAFDGGLGGDGGGIYNSGTLSINGSSISQNSAGKGGNGGLGRLMEHKYTDPINGNVHVDWIVGDPGDGGNGGNGGAIFNSGSTALINNTNIENNTAGTGGAGGIYKSYSEWQVYSANPASSGNGGSGGGIYSTGFIDKLQNTVINNNKAGRGGNGSPVAISPAENGGNGGNGGGIYAQNHNINIISCEISGNQAGNGGNGGTTQVDQPSNKPGNGGAGGTGGGIYIANNSDVVFNMLTTTIHNNSAGNGGAGGIDDAHNSHSSNGGNGGNGGAIAFISSLVNNIQFNAIKSTITNNEAGQGGHPFLNGVKGPDGVGGGFYSNTNNYLSMYLCRIVDNTPQAINFNLSTAYPISILFQNNWWGSNADPINQMAGSNVQLISYNPWIILSITANPPIADQVSAVTASLIMNSNGENTLIKYGITVPDGIPVRFSANSGTVNPADSVTQSGAANSIFTPESGTPSVTVNVDNQEITTPAADLQITKTVNTAIIHLGDIFIVTIKAGNKGPDIANDVIIEIPIPQAFEFISADVDQGSWNYDSNTKILTWNPGDVEVGDPYLNLTLKATELGEYLLNHLLTTITFDPDLNNQMAPLIITINAPEENKINEYSANAAGKTIGMQKTGNPVIILILAILMVGGCITGLKRNR